MEMKAQIEAAKEEKRRKEALAERKAQHVEATMRFQKGIKNFKSNKGKSTRLFIYSTKITCIALIFFSKKQFHSTTFLNK